MIIQSVLPFELLRTEERSNASQRFATGAFKREYTEMFQPGWREPKTNCTTWGWRCLHPVKAVTVYLNLSTQALMNKTRGNKQIHNQIKAEGIFGKAIAF